MLHCDLCVLVRSRVSDVLVHDKLVDVIFVQQQRHLPHADIFLPMKCSQNVLFVEREACGQHRLSSYWSLPFSDRRCPGAIYWLLCVGLVLIGRA